MEWYLKVLNQYADFKGRARRTEYWMFTLFNVLISIGITVLVLITGIESLSILSTLYSLAVLVPGLAVAVRRLHDINKSGWYFLLVLIPIAGPILLLIWFCTDSHHGPNEWGDNPKGLGNRSEIDAIGLE